ncbi:MAG: NADPH-dependent 7-cyano-7-deazaguanine reductase QueF [Succinivibrio sp.]|jgi:7-cyano-7-deazaguanine reductase|nr:NADPH-dependent 7-cyano-7-deazaguanine reductase QueF [Succinivibrio sp.]
MPSGNLPLGSVSVYADEYNPKVLCPIERSIGRAQLRYKSFRGFDLWRLYEITCLDTRGIPQVYCATLKVDASSPRIIESKSLKLYTLSFTMTKFSGPDEMAAIMRRDLSKELESEVEVQIWPVEQCPFTPAEKPGILIDNETPSGITYDYRPELLACEDEEETEELLRSDVLRTLCPVTSQPDHAEIFIRYRGRRISRPGLLAYLISLRTHKGFHEQCCELIYSDIKTLLKPERLCVCCNFTRRGGIDINPLRCEGFDAADPIRTLRQ